MGQLNITSTQHETFAHDSATFGAGSAQNGAAVRKADNKHIVFAFKNTTDQVVTITFQGSNDSVFTNAWTISGSLSLAVTTGSDYAVLSDAWPYIRAIYTPAGNPTSGSVTSFLMGN